MSSTSANHVRAFSLFEMVIVMVLVSIIAAIAIPKYSSALDRYRASSAAHKVAADLAMAQNAARSTSASCTVSFSSNKVLYSVSGVAALDGAAGTYYTDLSKDPYKASFVPNFASTSQVKFDGYGHPSSAGTVSVSSGHASFTVTLDAQSGACTIQ